MPMHMQFKENADVYDEHGEKVGTIDRVVIDPRTREVTHVVVREGFLFTEDKVVPIDWFSLTAEEKVLLKVPEEKVNELPDFEETHYIPWDEPDTQGDYTDTQATRGYAQRYYWYPRSNVYWWGYPGYRAYFGFHEPPYSTIVERQIPEGTVPLKEGADVISSDNEHVGDVERIFTHPDTGHATHFVISQGLIFKTRKLVPSAWIEAMEEGRVYLAVASDFLDQLEAYED